MICKKGMISRAIALAGMFASTSLLLSAVPPASRIRASLENGRTVKVSGNVSPRVASAVDAGEAAALQLPRITIHFGMTEAQQLDLESLLRAQQDPANPQYHQWLTPEQIADRFGLSQGDLTQIALWLSRKGFTDVKPARSRMFITMAGTAANVSAAFGTRIHTYRVGGETHYANVTDPEVPEALEGIVAGFRGLNDFRLKPHGIRAHAANRPRFTSSISGNHFLAPGDFAVIYDVQRLYDSGTNGSGQKLAVVGQTDIQLSDIEAFQSASGLPIKDPQVVLDGMDPGSSPGDEVESDLDLEWSGAVARGATIIFVNSMDVFTSATYAIDQNLAPVLSISYGLCESENPPATITAMNTVFQQGNAQGITIVAASGDTGAADCDEKEASSAGLGLAVDFPASSPYVIGAGGTEFNENGVKFWRPNDIANGDSALSYIPELAWNDTYLDGGLSASGGGASILFSKPYWQQGPGVPSDGVRDVPDVALSASADHDGYLLCSGGSCTNGFRDFYNDLDIVGGTSAAAPAFAGMVALVNQKTQSSQGNFNAALYTLAWTAPSAFHDITVGDNRVPCGSGTPDCYSGQLGYSTGPGYDQVTGLGSIDAYNLVNAVYAMVQAPAVTLNATGEYFSTSQGSGSVTVNPAGGGSWSAATDVSWITITGSASGSGSGTVNFSVAANTGATRSGIVNINGEAFTITQEGAPSGLNALGSMAQIASGAGWDTSITLINLGANAAEARMDFSGNSGNALMLPFTTPQQTFSGMMLGTTIDQNLNPYAQLVADVAGSANDAASMGWGLLSSTGTINGFAIFQDNGQEAVVPLETRNAPSYLVAFDNTGGLLTGLAVANVGGTSSPIPVILRDDTGAQIGTGQLSVASNGNTSFVLDDAADGFPITANKRGTIEVDTPAGGQVSVLCLRANGAAITTLPVFASVQSGNGTLAHIASGGGWQTSITLVNTGTTSAQISLNFFDEAGNPMTLPLLFPQTGVATSETSISQSLAAGASLVINTQGLDSQPAQVGSAALATAGGAVSGFAIFQNSGQEAVVPLVTGATDFTTLVFDNTNNVATGVAVANSSATAATIMMMFRDDTGATLGADVLTLPGNGHTSFILSAQYPATANLHGSVQFAAVGEQIGVVGIRSTPAGAYTTIPAMVQ